MGAVVIVVFLLCLSGWSSHCHGQYFTVVGNQVFYKGTWVKFKGIGLTCTEYMLKPGMDDPSKTYYGSWARNYCFGGPTSNTSTDVELNDEPDNVLSYLIPQGMHFQTNPTVTKVQFQSPYDEVITKGSAMSHPIIRIPMTGSCYLYDIDNDGGNHLIYQEIIDKLVTYFTSKNVAVILDLHWNCPDTTKLSCMVAQSAAMALKNYGSNPGSLAFWDIISKKYASNPYVFYELFNEPWIQVFNQWYAGDSTYAGMKDMYDVIRRNDPTGIVIIGGKDQYALDAQSGLAFYIQYKQDTGSYPTNIIWNIHPYQGAAQGLEHSLRSALRLSLALKTIGPVIFTEFGQYCCGEQATSCRKSVTCNDHLHSDHFVYNIVNMAEQYDLSWIGWAWRGNNINNANRPCQDGEADCNQPDMRDNGGILTTGSKGGANWGLVWSQYVAASSIAVQDTPVANLSSTTLQPAGFLPRPCIVGQFNLGGICGYDLSVNVTTLTVTEIITQSLYDSILPGLPPTGNCKGQGCEGFSCQTYTGPCKS